MRDQPLQGYRALGAKTRNIIEIGTWNIRGLLETGKINVVANAIKLYGIVSLTQIHWKKEGDFTISNVTFTSLEMIISRNGVTVILNKDLKNTVKEFSKLPLI